MISAAIITVFGCAAGSEDDEEMVVVGTTSTATATTTTTSTTEDESSEEGGSSGDVEDEPPPLECAAPLVPCGGVCVDLANDPGNCGLCGVACVLNNGNASCVAGVCAMETCAPGFADCDADAANGCEHMIDCQEGGSCPTSCGSGVVTCGDPCVATCSVPAETCNAIDDDCDGVCDQGPIGGCRVGVHRMYGNNGHHYTTNPNEPAAAGLEMVAENYFYVYTAAHDGLIPLHRCIKPNTGGRRFLSQDANCEGQGPPELTLGYMSPDADCGAFSLYRLWAPSIDFHFFTISDAERDNAVANFGYQDYGTQGLVFGGA